ncbi:hypothetical protein MCUN1_001965 [Malassezia cuniculi]|uniref:Major facilitator superfamily (MFS) profile domain-containing protein n=1 Tax=Malassezia cuniculi TaxID=948313 RepID=A0AAF0JBB1_9BASI|nr:hypothetical protein MCUN1_001965 [Malassezia cuniculi]
MASVGRGDPVSSNERTKQQRSERPPVGTTQNPGLLGTISHFFSGSEEPDLTHQRPRRPSDVSTYTLRTQASRTSQSTRGTTKHVVDRVRSAEQHARDRVVPGFLRSHPPQERGMQMGGAPTGEKHHESASKFHRARSNSQSSERSRPNWMNAFSLEYHPDEEHGEINHFAESADHPQLAVLEDTDTAPIDTEHPPDIFHHRRRPSEELRSIASRNDSESIFYDAQSLRDGRSIRHQPSIASRKSASLHKATSIPRMPEPAITKSDSIEREFSDDSVGTSKEEETPEAKPETKEEFKDIKIVAWDGEDDQEHPLSWPMWYRCYITFYIGMFTLASTYASSAPSSIIESISENFGVSDEVSRLSVFVYLAGYCLGPLVWSSMCENFGFKPVFIVASIGLTIFNIACGAAPNIGGLIIFRFLAGACGSCPLANGGAVIPSIFGLDLLGVGMAFFSLAPMAGPCLGPILGGWIFVSGTHFQWVYWSCAIFSGVCLFLTVFTYTETYPGKCLQRKARRMRNSTGDDRYKAEFELRTFSFSDLITRQVLVPIQLLIFEPMLVSSTLFLSFVYGTLYLLFEAFPIVFGELHGLNALQIGLCFLGFFVGCVIGTIYQVFVENKRYQREMARSESGLLPPEQRLYLCMISAPILVISLFWFAWTSYPHVSMWSPLVASMLFGLGVYFNFLSLMAFMADAYRTRAASAISANTIVRSAFGVGFPLFASQMYHNVNPRWASTILAFIAVAMFPIPFVLFKHGAWLRSKAKFAV